MQISRLGMPEHVIKSKGGEWSIEGRKKNPEIENCN